MSTKIEAVIFDFFGVIVTDALSVLCSELTKTSPEAVEALRDLIRAANKGILDPVESNKRAATLLGLSVDAYRERIRSGEEIDYQLLGYIKQLRPSYKTGLLSNITGSGLQRRFPKPQLAEYFDAVVASSDIGYAKPEPEAYQTICQRLQVPLQASVFLDDRPDYCDAARSLGMQAIVYETFAQAKRDLEGVLAKE